MFQKFVTYLNSPRSQQPSKLLPETYQKFPLLKCNKEESREAERSQAAVEEERRRRIVAGRRSVENPVYTV